MNFIPLATARRLRNRERFHKLVESFTRDAEKFKAAFDELNDAVKKCLPEERLPGKMEMVN